MTTTIPTKEEVLQAAKDRRGRDLEKIRQALVEKISRWDGEHSVTFFVSTSYFEREKIEEQTVQLLLEEIRNTKSWKVEHEFGTMTLS